MTKSANNLSIFAAGGQIRRRKPRFAQALAAVLSSISCLLAATPGLTQQLPPASAQNQAVQTTDPAPASGNNGSLSFTPPSADASAGDPQAPASVPAASNSPATASADPGASSPSDPGTPADPASVDPAQLAQATQKTGYSPAAPSRSLPVSVGSLQVRKPFKIFVREELIRNLSFRDTPVREVIAELARRGGINIFLDKSVSGSITGDLKDVTLNEAMDIVLASSSLESRIIDNNVIMIASRGSLSKLGLNRTSAKAFKLSYIHPYDAANLLYASVFNRGFITEMTATANTQDTNTDRTERRSENMESGGSAQPSGTGGARQTLGKTTSASNSGEDSSASGQFRDIMRNDTSRMLRGSSRAQIQEGVGYNNAATDPGSQQIRTNREIITDYAVEQNGGGAIVIPDTKNRQLIVVGTPDDLNLAEEAIRLMDRRPRQIHVQASLIELSNQAIRQIGANIALQGAGASTSILGNAAAPLVSLLPGLGGSVPTVSSSFSNNITIAQGGTAFASTSNIVSAVAKGALVAPTSPFAGLIGSLLPLTPTPIANVTPVSTSETGFNFLTLSKRAGGNANIATFPAGLNVSLNLLLETEKSKIIANPSVIVNDNSEALITIANEVLHKVTSTVSLGVVSTNIELTKAGIFLNVLPRVTEDGFIVMRMRPQVSQPFGPPIILANNTVEVQLLSIREIMAQEVRVKDGQTLVVGGLFTENEASQISKVPYLAEAPVLGALFRNTLKGRSRTELLLLITPKIVEEEPVATGPGAPPSL